MYHLAEDFAIWVFSLSIDEAAWVRRVAFWYAGAQLPFFATACCTCFSWGSLRRDTDAISRFMVRLHATRRRAIIFSLVYLLYALPLAGAAVAEHAAFYSPRVQPAYEHAAEQGRLPGDSAYRFRHGSSNRKAYGHLRIFHRGTHFVALPCAILGQVFWWSGHGRLRRMQNG